MIHPMPAQRIDTVVADPVTGDQRRRTDYAGTVWYGDRPQITGAMVMSRGATAQITTPFWLLDSHVYEAGATGNAQIQASAAVQGTSEPTSSKWAPGWARTPRTAARCWVYVAVTAVANLPLGVAYRVTVICGPDAIRPPAT